MLSNLVTMFTQTQTQAAVKTAAITPKTSPNPFGQQQNANPFLSGSFGSNENYAKNMPIQGGYFAGYHEGKANIVGRRLFLEV